MLYPSNLGLCRLVAIDSGKDVLTQLLLKGPELFGCLALLHLELLHLLAGSIHIAERSILDRSDALDPVLPLRFRRLSGLVKPDVELLSRCLDSVGSSTLEVALLCKFRDL